MQILTKNNILPYLKTLIPSIQQKKTKKIYFQTKLSGLACQITIQFLEFLIFDTDTDVEKNTDANISFKRSQFEICNFQKKLSLWSFYFYTSLFLKENIYSFTLSFLQTL